MLKDPVDGDCEKWPEGCETCDLVELGLVKPPKRWVFNDTAEMADWYQLYSLLMKHIRGDCSSYWCVFCWVDYYGGRR